MDMDHFQDNMRVVVIGASGGIGRAFLERLRQNERIAHIYALSRSMPAMTGSPKISTGHIDLTDEATIENAAKDCAKGGPLDLIIVATGILHDGENLQPEKSLKELSAGKFETAFAVNTIGPALVAKHFLPLIHKEQKAVMAVLSARVGSIADNHIGGWYSYRASKAALNMVLKNAAIETARRYKKAAIIGLQPGTVDTTLSKPFQSHVPADKLFTPDFAAQRLLDVIDNVTAGESGMVFDWDGQKTPY